MTDLLANVCVAAGRIVLAALGFSLVFSVCRVFHIAQAAVYLFAAYVFLALLGLGVPAAGALAGGAVAGASFGVAIYLLVYRPLARRKGSTVGALVASFGVTIVAQNAIALVVGDAHRGVSESQASWFAAEAVRVLIVAGAVVVATVLAFALRYSRYGREVRAVGQHPELAELVGIRGGAVVSGVFFVGSLVASVGGILDVAYFGITPWVGLEWLLLGAAGALVGGVGSVGGVVLGCVLVAAVQQITILMVPGQWENAIVFSLLFVTLLARPDGVLPEKLRRG